MRLFNQASQDSQARLGALRVSHLNLSETPGRRAGDDMWTLQTVSESWSLTTTVRRTGPLGHACLGAYLVSIVIYSRQYPAKVNWKPCQERRNRGKSRQFIDVGAIGLYTLG